MKAWIRVSVAEKESDGLTFGQSINLWTETFRFGGLKYGLRDLVSRRFLSAILK